MKRIIISVLMILILSQGIALAADDKRQEQHINDRAYEWFVTQLDGSENQFTNCGPACMAMISKWCGIDLTVSEIRQELGYNGDAKLCDLISIIKAHGISAGYSQINVRTPEITAAKLEAITDKLANGSVICVLQDFGTYRHYVVVFGAYVLGVIQYYVYYDPLADDRPIEAQAQDIVNRAIALIDIPGQGLTVKAGFFFKDFALS